LWPDTFNNAFYPEILQAAVTVLSHAGYQVDLPRKRLCCGRTMMEHGWLDRIRAGWRVILDELADDIAAGTPLIGIEPSCTVMFRDELPALLPRDERAACLAKNTFTLAEFLGQQAHYQPPSAGGRLAYHDHCQHRAVIGVGAEPKLLERAGYQVAVLDYGCCGMAGAFGFQKRTYPLSKQLAERGLIPKVHELRSTSLIVTDGFSCREQIRSLGAVRALHTAEVLASGLAPSQ
jgi:Fe-S oxidoreductase